ADVHEVETLMKDRVADIQKELDAHPSFESWAREGLEMSKRAVYLNGDLKVAVSGGRRPERDEDVPQAPADYAPNCGRVARIQIGKAGLRLADQLKKLFP